jgi:hypothetical protein
MNGGRFGARLCAARASGDIGDVLSFSYDCAKGSPIPLITRTEAHKMAVSCRWTLAEIDIVKTYSVPEAKKRLPQRTTEAIRTRRTLLQVGVTRRPWTKAETERILRHGGEPLDKLARRFKRRTPNAVKHQHAFLVGCHRRPTNFWKTTEVARLNRIWPSSKRSELLAAFPGRTWGAIKIKAENLGLRRTKTLVECVDELRDAIRQRALEDGIGLMKLGAETRWGTFFARNMHKVADLNKIGRAVEFFGGRLVIDWQDE